MPVRIWSRSRLMDALPRTYHQPTRPATSRGMGCFIIESKVSRRRNRASNQSPTTYSERIMGSSPSGDSGRSGRVSQGVLERRVVRRLDFEYVQPAGAGDAVDAAVEAARRRARGALAV